MPTVIYSNRGTGGHIAGASTANIASSSPTTTNLNGTAREVHEASDPGDLRRWVLVFVNDGSVAGPVTVSGATLEMTSFIGGSSAGNRTFDLRNILVDVDTSQATWTDRLTGTAWTTPGAAGTPGEVESTPVASVAFNMVASDVTSNFTSSAFDTLLSTWLGSSTGTELRLLMSRDPLLAGGGAYNEFAGVAEATYGPMLTIPYTAGGGAPTVSTVSSNNANEGTSIVHTVTLSAATTVAEVYAITLAGGTATGGGTDYTNTLTNGMFSNSVTVSGGNITVPIGVSSFTVTIPTTTDALVEGAETYTLTIGGTAGTGTINDLVVFTVNSVDLGSFTGFATFTVTASATSGVDRDIVCTTSNGTASAGVDYTATTQTVTILAGNLTADFLVPIINTRKPDTDLVTTGWTVTGAANHSAALADNTDTSYTTSPDVTASPGPLKTQMLPTPLAAGTHTRQIRANYTTTPCDVKMSLLNSSDVVQGDSGWVSLTASIADYTLAITTTGSSTRFLFEVRATP